MANDYDVAIIGSGFGGAVTACRLSEAGRRVLVLERGREWTADEYPGIRPMPGSGTTMRRHGTMAGSTCAVSTT